MNCCYEVIHFYSVRDLKKNVETEFLLFKSYMKVRGSLVHFSAGCLQSKMRAVCQLAATLLCDISGCIYVDAQLHRMCAGLTVAYSA